MALQKNDTRQTYVALIYISRNIKRPGTKVLTNAELCPEIHFHFIANLPAEGSPPLEYSRCAQAYLRSLIL